MKFLSEFQPRILFVFVLCILSELSVCRAKEVVDFIWSGANRAEIAFNSTKESSIICYENKQLRLDFQNLWRSVQFDFSSSGADYSICYGASVGELSDECNKFPWRLSKYLILWKIQSLSVPPFNRTCVLIEADQPVLVELQIKVFDIWIFARLIGGLVLFFLASKLSRNILFYYGSGITLGVLASTLIAIFILSRFIPKKGVAMGFLAASFSLSAYVIRSSWQELQEFAFSHMEYFIAYFLISGLLGFCVFYYKGPVSNPRLLNLIKWTIQCLALVVIYSGTQISVVSGTIVLLVLLFHFMPSCSCGLGDKFRKYWKRKFPPKIPLLTEDEYIEQGRVETQKALAELRAFCRSPDCQAWKTISRLKSPNRFAQWVDCDSDHILEQEHLDHDFNPSPRRHIYDDDDFEDD